MASMLTGVDNQLKEQEIVNLLSDWLFAWGFNVYQNHKNTRYGVFSVKGELKQKPDLIITPTRKIPFRCILEVKPAHMSDVAKGTKIINYYKNFVENKTQYFIDGKKEFTPDFFLLATNQSLYGKLFFTFIRSLYKQWKKEDRRHGVGLGILSSDLLNGGRGRPAIQGQVHRGWDRLDRIPTWHEVFYIVEG